MTLKLLSSNRSLFEIYNFCLSSDLKFCNTLCKVYFAIRAITMSMMERMSMEIVWKKMNFLENII